MTKRILLIAYNFPPLISPQSLRWFYLVKELSKQGFIIDVLTIRMPEVFKDLLDELTENVNPIRTFPGPFYYLTYKYSREKALSKDNEPDANPSIYWRLVSKVYYWTFRSLNKLLIPDIYSEWFPFAIVKGLELNKKKRYDLILSSSEPRICHVVGYLLKKKTGFPWIADYGDPWIYPIPTHTVPEYKRKIIEKIESKILKSVDAITVASEGIKDLYVGKYPFLSEQKISVVTQGFDSDVLSKVSEDRPDKFRIVYCGSFYKNLRDPLVFFEAIREIGNKDIEVVIAGRINEFVDILKNQFHDIIDYRGFLSHKQSLSLQKGATVLLHVGNVTDVQVPGKIYEYIGARRPILCIRGSDRDPSADLLINYKRGIVTNNNKEDIKRGIEKFYKLWQEGLLESSFNLEEIEEFSWRKKAEEISNIIKAL